MATKSGAEFARKRQLLVFDRFLARIVAVLGDTVTLKGGLVLELRLERARTTKDIDLRLMGSPDNVLATLQEAARRDLGDFMTFEVAPDDGHPEIQNDGMLYDGLRFRVECRIAGKLYGQRFGVDVVFGGPIFGEKDLPDLALLASVQSLDARRLRTALEQTFDFRKTHHLPERLPQPAAAWAAPYAAMAREDQLKWPTLDDVTEAARAFLDPVLADKLDAVWDPKVWAWK